MQFCGTRKGAQLSIYLYYTIYLGIKKERERERDIEPYLESRVHMFPVLPTPEYLVLLICSIHHRESEYISAQ